MTALKNLKDNLIYLAIIFELNLSLNYCLTQVILNLLDKQ